MSDALDVYTAWWRTRPWHWRLRQRMRWRAESLWAALRGRPGPGELLLLRLLRKDQIA